MLGTGFPNGMIKAIAEGQGGLHWYHDGYGILTMRQPMDLFDRQCRVIWRYQDGVDDPLVLFQPVLNGPIVEGAA